MLVSKGKISDMKNVTIDSYEPCDRGKQKKVTFAKMGQPPKTRKLELVHFDFYNPCFVSSMGGSMSL